MQDIIQIAKTIEKAGGRLYLVGGAVRDEILKREIHDKDYCVTGITKEEFQKIFPQAIQRGKSFPVFDLYNEEFAFARRDKKIAKGHKGFEIEFSPDITIEEDLARRDITINSIAKDILTDKIIDPFGGKEDIKRGKIKATTTAFAEDPLRAYRVARFAAQLGFEVEEETLNKMKDLKQELSTLSKERIFTEFKKALDTSKPSIFFRVLKRADILDVHFKEIASLIGAIQPVKYHPEGDAYEHTMKVLDRGAELTDKLEIRFSCLVHDLGKGNTPKQILPHHYGHEERGVPLVQKLGSRVGVPKSWIKCGKVAAKEHMRAGKFYTMTEKKQVDLIERVYPTMLGLEGLQIVAIADRTSRGINEEVGEFLDVGRKCMQQVNGGYIIKKYGLKEGVQIKKKLHEERVKWMKNNN